MVQVRVTRAKMLVAGIGALLLVQGASAAAAQMQAGAEVPVRAFAYEPTTLTVAVGTTVTWTNLDPVAHTVTDIHQAWDSGLFEENGTFSMTFTAPGTYQYYCVPHPMMIGTVEVTG
jgi:plastocyanin